MRTLARILRTRRNKDGRITARQGTLPKNGISLVIFDIFEFVNNAENTACVSFTEQTTSGGNPRFRRSRRLPEVGNLCGITRANAIRLRYLDRDETIGAAISASDFVVTGIRSRHRAKFRVESISLPSKALKLRCGCSVRTIARCMRRCARLAFHRACAYRFRSL